MKRFVPNGKKQFAGRLDGTPAAPAEAAALGLPPPKPPQEFEFVEGEVYDVNIALSTGSGEPRPGDITTTVFKRDLGQSYQLRAKTARQVFSEITKRFPTMPFSARQLQSEDGGAGASRCILGLKECVSRGLLIPLDPTEEPAGESVAQCRFTAVLYNGKTIILPSHPMQPFKPTEGVTLAEPVRKVVSANRGRLPKQVKWTSHAGLMDAVAEL